MEFKFASLLVIFSIFCGIYLLPADWFSWLKFFEKSNPNRIHWIYSKTDEHEMMNHLFYLANPVVLLNTPFNQWDYSNLTFKKLAQSSVLVPCKSSKNPVFQYYAVNQPLETFSTPKLYHENLIQLKEFVKRILNPSNTYHYSSGDIHLLNLPRLYSPDSLKSLTFPLYEGAVQVNFWFGGSNVTAYTHYDTSHNLHFVVKGKKKFILFPPSLHDKLLLYSCLHPLYRQTQLDVLNNTLLQEIDITPLILDIQPNEVLYIPPYWFHCVITMEASISLNVWTDSQDFNLMEQVLNSPIPFEEKWSKDTLMRAAKLFINSVLKNIQFPEEFVKDAVLPRYRSILSEFTTSDKNLQTVLSYCPTPSNLSDNTLYYITSTAETISYLFLKMSSLSVRQINVGNYIEHILYTLLREELVYQIPLFLQECW